MWPAAWSSRALERPITPALRNLGNVFSVGFLISAWEMDTYPMTTICEGILVMMCGLMAD